MPEMIVGGTVVVVFLVVSGCLTFYHTLQAKYDRDATSEKHRFEMEKLDIRRIEIANELIQKNSLTKSTK